MIFRLFGKNKKQEPSLQRDEKKEVETFDDIAPVSEFMKKETGVDFNKQLSILHNKVVTFCRKRHITSFTMLITSIRDDHHLKQELINTLTTNESYFYREFKQIEELIELARNRSTPFSILCAPSATGEEPYSIAIALLEAGIPQERFSITGIDVNTKAIENAEKGLYRQRNIRNLPTSVIDKHFIRYGDEYMLNDAIKSLIHFKNMNLFDPAVKELGSFDFVFSRNMLIYFDKETKFKAKNILESLRKNDETPVFFGHADFC